MYRAAHTIKNLHITIMYKTSLYLTNIVVLAPLKVIDYNVNGFRHIAELSNIHVLNNFDNSQHAIFITCYSVVYQSSENRAVLLRGCVSLVSSGSFCRVETACNIYIERMGSTS